MSIYQKMIDEAMGAQRADVSVLKAKRGTDFKVKDGQAYVDAVNKMTAGEGQSKAVIDLHKYSVNAHFDTLTALTNFVKPEDDPYVEHYQTPVVLEILCEEDEGFKKSVDKFIEQIGKSEALIGLESARRYAGFYGPTCVVDFALIPGSTSNVVNQILTKTDIPQDHKKAILAAKSWGMNTSYGVGDVFAHDVEDGKTLSDAVSNEIKELKYIYESPVSAQADLMDSVNMDSFDVRKYMRDYRKEMEPYVKAAIDDGVHYANIVTVPAYCVGDIAHHIAQSTYNMCKDDMVMGIIEAVTDVIENSLRQNVDKFNSVNQVLSLATGSSAAAAEYILELDGFNGPSVVEFLTRRFHNFVQLYPTRGAAAELHNCDFMDMVYRGWNIMDRARKVKNGTSSPMRPNISGLPIDLIPVQTHDVIQNPQRYVYPACAITVRFAAMMSLADYPCLLTSEPVTATLMTNVVALDKNTAAAPVRACKNCASASCVDFRHEYCQYREAV
ncbi:DUF2193 domain-containing protein [Methanoplanus sp. FWC-SCC4]|uniref:DUF2193 domain-containing protein n=1 Tax=Methanochimaera problematica TaxID=2609417 RepID=A0AA97FFQ3_9EURY|nr:DUF2193 domain-containing protein [Methanoplanus sp. FWC-SCC4]WOF16611.1 DUF2193 domain-containing protein [Methanoplanus sp. FWC-SCC4]